MKRFLAALAAAMLLTGCSASVDSEPVVEEVTTSESTGLNTDDKKALFDYAFLSVWMENTPSERANICYLYSQYPEMVIDEYLGRFMSAVGEEHQGDREMFRSFFKDSFDRECAGF